MPDAGKQSVGLGVLGAFVLVLASILLSIAFTQSSADAAPADKVDICHATSSHSNPYVGNQPDKSADVSGHDGHNGPIWFSGITVTWGDIIPPFTYSGGSYPGKNWTAQGQAIYNNNCNIPTATPTATPTVTPTATPTVTPTATPTVTPTTTPTVTPTATPTSTPTTTPSVTPTSTPIITPTVTPTVTPTPTNTSTGGGDGDEQDCCPGVDPETPATPKVAGATTKVATPQVAAATTFTAPATGMSVFPSVVLSLVSGIATAVIQKRHNS